MTEISLSLCEDRLIHSIQNLIVYQRSLQPTRFTLFSIHTLLLFVT